MELIPYLVFLVIFVIVETQPYRIIQEKIVVEYVDPTCVELLADVIKYNNSVNAVNLTVTPKMDFHPNAKISVRGFKSLNQKYQLPLFRYDINMKQAVQMESFDVLALRMDYSHPPLIWPLQKGVTYRIVGWNPEGSRFLPNIPLGKWMFKVSGLHPDRTKAAQASWFFRMA